MISAPLSAAHRMPAASVAFEPYPERLSTLTGSSHGVVGNAGNACAVVGFLAYGAGNMGAMGVEVLPAAFYVEEGIVALKQAVAESVGSVGAYARIKHRHRYPVAGACIPGGFHIDEMKVPLLRVAFIIRGAESAHRYSWARHKRWKDGGTAQQEQPACLLRRAV